MALKLYNTMGTRLQEFIPVTPKKVGFYGCGPTVYNYAHIGNLRAYVFQDTLSRMLRFLGYEVKHVMNITDVGHLSDDADAGEDKMVQSAKKRGKSVLEIADFYTNAFFRDCTALNIVRPNIVCKATDHIAEMIELIKQLEERGHTYFSGGNLYYDISTFPDYGKLANINLDDLKAGARIEIDKNKRNPYDFVLWFTRSKFENHALSWESPWGKGYPGWHIECSAMSMKYLGHSFDIHSGGIDHVRIHHTNEIAQSEGATGKTWVHYWLHNEFLIMEKGKMSKSSGEFITLEKIIDKGYDPLDYRFLLLSGHYRSQITFSWDAMDTAKHARKNFQARVTRLMENLSSAEDAALKAFIPNSKNYKGYLSQLTDTAARAALAEFKAAVERDIATPHALSVLQQLVKNADIPPIQALMVLHACDSVLGLSLLEKSTKQKSESQIENIEHIKALIAERVKAKAAKNYAMADKIRNELKAQGIMLEDTISGTTWRKL